MPAAGNCEAQRDADRRRAALLGTTVSTGANMDDPAWGRVRSRRISGHARSASPTSSFTPHFRRKKSNGGAPPVWPRSPTIAANRNVIVSRTGVAALFGPHHPFGYDNSGTEESNKAMSRADMMNFWQTYYVPNNAALWCGEYLPGTAEGLGAEKFGTWSTGKPRGRRSARRKRRKRES